jgi:hypothetical protein
MIRGLKVNFSHSGCSFDFAAPVVDKQAIVQDCMVNIATARGSDPLNPEKGTDLLKDTLQGGAINIISAGHIGAAAAVDTLFFMREEDLASQPIKLTKIKLKPITLIDRAVNIEAQFDFTDDTTIGVINEI